MHFVIFCFIYSIGNLFHCLQPNNQFIELDGRKFCPDCHGIAIMGNKKLKPLVKKMHKFYEENLDLKVDKNIPILLVDRKEINKFSSPDDGSVSAVLAINVVVILFNRLLYDF
jgi:hypothetical protein